MLGDILRHLGYFVPRLTGYGAVLGALFGGLTYWILGAFVGLPWGLLAGLVLGLLMGIGVPVFNRFFAPDDEDTYRTQLALGAGMIATIVMALPLLFIYALVAGLVTAYVAHRYTDDPTRTGEKRKHSGDAYQKRERVFTHAAKTMMGKARYVVLPAVALAIGAYWLAGLTDPFTYFEWPLLLGIGVGGTIYGFIVASFVAAINALFIVMINRLFFDPEMPKAQYKARLVPAVAVLTLFLSMVVTFGVGAPFAAIAGAFGASKYADWYYEHHGEEKAKHSAQKLLDQPMSDDGVIDDEIAYYDRNRI